MTEREYRALHRLSYSWISNFLDDRLDYYERFEKIPPRIEDNSTERTVFGNLVETLLWHEDEFSEKFETTDLPRPSGHMGEFTIKLFELTKRHTTINGIVDRSMESMMEEAYTFVRFDSKGQGVKFKTKSLERVIEEFTNSEYEQYYLKKRQLVFKSLIHSGDYNRGKEAVKRLRECPFTSDLVNVRTSEGIEVYRSLIILYVINGLDFKTMLDQVIVDHHRKVIHIHDLKTTSDPLNFDRNYRKYHYYIQSIIYHLAIIAWARNNGLESYEIIPMKFIIADSNNKHQPFVSQCNSKTLLDAKIGFWHKDDYYPGLEETLRDLIWHRSTNIWDCSRKVSEGNGCVDIKTYNS